MTWVHPFGLNALCYVKGCLTYFIHRFFIMIVKRAKMYSTYSNDFFCCFLILQYLCYSVKTTIILLFLFLLFLCVVQVAIES